MAKAEQHFGQAKSNLEFLEGINKALPTKLDWQVTVCFYITLHIINAHIPTVGVHYKSHRDVFNAISPKATASPSKLPDLVFLAYQKLFELSRRARYLVLGT